MLIKLATTPIIFFLYDLCINNNTYPFFEDPTNVKECEKVRLDLVKKIPENLLNNYFGVESFGDYSPPKYNGEK